MMLLKFDFVNTGEKIIITIGKARFRNLTTMHVTVSSTSLFFMFVCGDYLKKECHLVSKQIEGTNRENIYLPTLYITRT